MLREGIAAVLASEQDIVLVVEASNGREAVEQFRTHHPDVTLMDVQMPEVNGIDAIVKIREEFPDARIIVLTTYTRCPGSSRIQSRRVRLYVKEHGTKGIDRYHPHGPCRQKRIPAEIAVEIAQHHSDDALTEREIEVLREVAAGNANKMVGQRLNISEEEVKAHMKSILSKLGANDRTHAVTIA